MRVWTTWVQILPLPVAREGQDVRNTTGVKLSDLATIWMCGGDVSCGGQADAAVFPMGTWEQDGDEGEGEGWSQNLVSDIASQTHLRDGRVERSSRRLNIWI